MDLVLQKHASAFSKAHVHIFTQQDICLTRPSHLFRKSKINRYFSKVLARDEPHSAPMGRWAQIWWSTRLQAPILSFLNNIGLPLY
jgi:hypothetical protein